MDLLLNSRAATEDSNHFCFGVKVVHAKVPSSIMSNNVELKLASYAHSASMG